MAMATLDSVSGPHGFSFVRLPVFLGSSKKARHKEREGTPGKNRPRKRLTVAEGLRSVKPVRERIEVESLLPFVREPAQNEFLHQAAEHPFARGDSKILEHQVCASVRGGIVQVGEC
jgi:hypothetical protein